MPVNERDYLRYSMARDLMKRVIAVGIGVQEGELRVILILDDDRRLIVASQGLTRTRAEVLCDGYFEDLREGAKLPRDMVVAFVSDPRAIAALEMPAEMSPNAMKLFKLGVVGGMELALQGYWVRSRTVAAELTLH
jgi:hypothetical protein